MEQPNALVYVALIAYLPFVLACFGSPGGRRGLLLALMAGWLFLPWFRQFGESVPLLHTKQMFVPAVVLAASLVLDAPVWRTFRLRAADLPVAGLCAVPLFSALAAHHGWYEAGSAFFEQLMTWGAPYLLGRAYLGRPDGIRDAARAVVAAGLLYLPFCLWEVRMSPQLHRQIYGFAQHSFVQHIRGGHFRPMLFMAHGLMVAMFMAVSTLVAYWLWRTRAMQAVAGIRLGWAALALGVTTLLCRSAGAAVLLLAGILVLEGTRLLRTSLLVLALACAPAAYCTLRMSGADAKGLVELSTRWLGAERAESLHFRLVNEEMIVERAMAHPWLGWGRGNDARVHDEEGRDVSVVDGLWIIAVGTQGLMGLIATGLVLAEPLLLLLLAFRGRRWADPRVAPAAALALAVGLWAIDDLLNAMVSPVFPLVAGAVVSFALHAVAVRQRRGIAPARAAPPVGRSPVPA
jgi:hypothetical protein